MNILIGRIIVFSIGALMIGGAYKVVVDVFSEGTVSKFIMLLCGYLGVGVFGIALAGVGVFLIMASLFAE